jgi:Arylsulfotransferase (ASST)/Secretion system C-terminal sorting domain
MKSIRIFVLLLLVAFVMNVSAQTTIGLTYNSGNNISDGYTLFSPMSSFNSYLIDRCGKQVKTWTSTYRPGLSSYLMEDGSLLRTGNAMNTFFNAGGRGGAIQKYDWNGNLVWSYTVSDSINCAHHDICPLPNGNVLVIAWQVKSSAVAVANGRNPALVTPKVWSEQILEIQPVGSTGGNIVWQWNLWDHLVQEFDSTRANYASVESNPQLVNINYNASSTNADWIHLNSVDYNPALDQIVLSAHAFDEIWIIDHSTTTAQATGHTGGNAGKGGDILYRWGNPATYNAAGAQQFFGQHNAHWIKPGFPYENQIMVFNNGIARPGGNYSTIEIINPPLSGFNYNATLPYLPNNPTWKYNDANVHNFFAQNISGAQGLANGNVIYTDGPSGEFVEIDSAGNKLWSYMNPIISTGALTQGTIPSNNAVFHCNFYPTNFSGFIGKTLTSTTILENTNVLSDSCSLTTGINSNDFIGFISVYPNPANDYLQIEIATGNSEKTMAIIYDNFGRAVKQFLISSSNNRIDIHELSTGNYYLKIAGTNESLTKRFSVIR